MREGVFLPGQLYKRCCQAGFTKGGRTAAIDADFTGSWSRTTASPATAIREQSANVIRNVVKRQWITGELAGTRRYRLAEISGVCLLLLEWVIPDCSFAGCALHCWQQALPRGGSTSGEDV